MSGADQLANVQFAEGEVIAHERAIVEEKIHPGDDHAVNEKREPPAGVSVDRVSSRDAGVISSEDGHNLLDPEGNVWVHPTEDEKHGPNALPRVVDKIPWNAYLIGICEMAERLSYYGCQQVFTNYLQRAPPPGGNSAGAALDTGYVSGALGLGTQVSSGLTTFNQFWIYVIPIFAGYVSDTYLGRFRTISWAVLIALIGHILLIVSALPSVIAKPNSAVGVFAIAIIIMGIGTGSFKSCIAPLVAEQYKVTALRVKTLKSGERVIIDPALTTARIYLYFYLMINVGALIGPISMTYAEKYVGFWLAYTIPTIAFLICPVVLYIGRNRYQLTPPTGSVVGTAFRILREALRGTWSWSPLKTYRNWNRGDFWAKARPANVLARAGGEGERPKWLTYDDEYVDEVKRGFKACLVFAFFPLYWLAYNPITSQLTTQAATMSLHGVPNDIINNLDPFALLILIPIFANFIYPALERAGIHFTPLKRVFMGFMVGTCAMIWAAVTQYYIYKTSPCGYYANGNLPNGDPCPPSPLNVWIQSGSYVLIAISEIFASVTGLEYAFTKAPKNMRSLVVGVFYLTSAISAAINEAMNPLAEDPNFIWNYGAPAIIAFVAGIVFWILFRGLDKEEDELNEIGADRIEAAATASNQQSGPH